MDRRVDERKRRGHLFLRSVEMLLDFSLFFKGKKFVSFGIQIWIEINLYL